MSDWEKTKQDTERNTNSVNRFIIFIIMRPQPRINLTKQLKN
jgi:hypothetical protein